MSDPYKSAFNVEHNIAIELDEVKEMATELQNLKEDYEKQFNSIQKIKHDLRHALVLAESRLRLVTSLGIHRDKEKGHALGSVESLKVVLKDLERM